MIISVVLDWLRPAKAVCRCTDRCGCHGVPEKWLVAVAVHMERVK
jgi:hypothetical protein